MDIYTALKSASKLENFILSEFDFNKGMYSTTFAKLNSISEKCEMVHSKIQSCVKVDKQGYEEDPMKKAIELANQLSDVLDRISSNGSTISSSYDDMVNLHDTVKFCADKLGIDTSEHDPPKTGLDEKLDIILSMLKNNPESKVTFSDDSILSDSKNKLESDEDEHSDSIQPDNSERAQMPKKEILKLYSSTMKSAKNFSTGYKESDILKDIICRWFETRFSMAKKNKFTYNLADMSKWVQSITIAFSEAYLSNNMDEFNRNFGSWIDDVNSGENKYPVPYFVKDAYENPSAEAFKEFTFSIWELVLTRAFDKLIMFKSIPIKYIYQESCFLGINDIVNYLDRLYMDNRTKYRTSEYSKPYHEDKFFRSKPYLTCLEEVEADA